MIKPNSAFTIIEILIVVGILGFLSSIAFLNYFTTNKMSTKAICISNLKQIDGAIDQWAIDYGIENSAELSAAQEEQIYTYIEGDQPKCPSNGQYTFKPTGSNPQVACSKEESEGHTLSE